MLYKIQEIMPEDYPLKLLKIRNHPKKLYAIGNIALLHKASFGIVGTRRITEYGKKICKTFAKEFSLRNIPVISGMAIGVDEIAHRTTLEYEGETIAVLGFGFEYAHSEGNKELFEEIIKNNGLIISEYSESTEKSKENFPKRNRIIAALSEGVLVVEAAEKSGSAITARWANKYDKKVFAIPGKIDDKMSCGTNKLIKEFAILTTKIEDIIECYPQFIDKKRKNISEKIKIKSNEIKDEWKEIISCIEKDGKTIDELQLETNKNIRDLLKILTEMEILEIIHRNSKMEFELQGGRR